MQYFLRRQNLTYCLFKTALIPAFIFFAIDQVIYLNWI